MKTRICSNPHCAYRIGLNDKWGLCLSCRFALRRGLYYGGAIGAAVVVIVKAVYEIWRAV